MSESAVPWQGPRILLEAAIAQRLDALGQEIAETQAKIAALQARLSRELGQVAALRAYQQYGEDAAKESA